MLTVSVSGWTRFALWSLFEILSFAFTLFGFLVKDEMSFSITLLTLVKAITSQAAFDITTILAFLHSFKWIVVLFAHTFIVLRVWLEITVFHAWITLSRFGTVIASLNIARNAFVVLFQITSLAYTSFIDRVFLPMSLSIALSAIVRLIILAVNTSIQWTSLTSALIIFPCSVLTNACVSCWIGNPLLLWAF